MPRSEFKITDFSGGINKGVDYSLIKVNQAADAQNMDIDRAVLKVGKGCVPFLTSLPGEPKSIFVYWKDNVGYWIVACNGQLYKYNNVSWESIGGGFQSDYWDALNYNYNSTDVIILCNGTDNTKVYNGSVLRDLYFDPTDTNSKAPKGKYIALHRERIWMADDTSLYASKDLNPDDWTAPTTPITEVDQHGVELPIITFDGSKITGLTVIFDDLIIWKERSVHKIFGSDPSNYQRVDFSPKGGISDRSIADFEGGSFFIDKSGIYLYSGANVTFISELLGETFAGLNEDYINKAAGIVKGNKYYLAVPEGSSIVNNLIIEYDFMKKHFMFKRGIDVYAWIEYKSKLYYVSTDSKIFEYNSGDTWDGQPINAYWETSYSDLGAPEVIKDMDMLYFTGFGSGNVKFTITTEQGSLPIQQALSTTEKVYAVDIAHMGRLLKLRIENVDGSIFTIKAPKIKFDLDYD